MKQDTLAAGFLVGLIQDPHAIVVGSESLGSILPYPMPAPATSLLVYFHYNFKDRPKRHASLLDSDLRAIANEETEA